LVVMGIFPLSDEALAESGPFAWLQALDTARDSATIADKQWLAVFPRIEFILRI
jgi:hypothetical protein